MCSIELGLQKCQHFIYFIFIGVVRSNKCFEILVSFSVMLADGIWRVE